VVGKQRNAQILVYLPVTYVKVADNDDSEEDCDENAEEELTALK